MARALVDRGAGVVGILRDETAVQLLDVRGIGRRVNLVHGDLTDPGLVMRTINEYDVDTIFHLAAQSQVTVANRAPISTFKSNIEGTWQVLDAARQLPTVERVVVASSDKAYGSHADLPYTEETDLRGSYPYDVSKACTDLLARSYWVTYQVPVAILRCANVYGPGDLNWARLIPGTIRAALRGEDPIIRSDGTPERDYVHIDDAVEAYVRVAAALPEVAGEAFNAGSGSPVAVIDLVNRILAAVGSEGVRPRIMATTSAEIDRQYLNSDKALDWLGWQPRVDLDRGLGSSVTWYRIHLQEELRTPTRPS